MKTIVLKEAHSIKDFFNWDKGNIFYFEGPVDSEWIWKIDALQESNSQKIFSLLTITEDLSGRTYPEERIKKQNLVVSNTTVTFNNTIIIKGPIIKGSFWFTPWKVMTGKESIAMVKITDISFDTVKITAIIEAENSHYIEQITFTVEYGITDFQWFINSDETDFYLSLFAVSRKTEDNSKWFDAYHIREDIQNLIYPNEE